MTTDSNAGRWGLVLGSGGLLGGAWLVGALTALEERTGRDARSADVIVGTSVGSLYAALLAAGASTAQLLDHQQGRRIASGPLAGVEWDYDNDVVLAARPLLGASPGSTKLLASNVRRLRELPPATVVSALIPQGRGSQERIGELLAEVVDAPWVGRGQVRIVAVDYDSGTRICFTGPGEGVAAPPGTSMVEGVPIDRAVMASCAVPGWFPPVETGGHRYVDGGVWSGTNADLVAGDRLDEVYVLAPLVSFSGRQARSVREVLDRQWRQAVTRRCMREVALLSGTGVRVTVLGPVADDLRVMGTDMMDAGRRIDVVETSLRTSRAALADPQRIEVPR